MLSGRGIQVFKAGAGLLCFITSLLVFADDGVLPSICADTDGHVLIMLIIYFFAFFYSIENHHIVYIVMIKSRAFHKQTVCYDRQRVGFV